MKNIVSSLCIVAVCTCSVPGKRLKPKFWSIVNLNPPSLMTVQGVARSQPSEIGELAFRGWLFVSPGDRGWKCRVTWAQSWSCAFVLWLVSQNLDIRFLFTGLGEKKAVKWTIKPGAEREGGDRSDKAALMGGEVDHAALPSWSLGKMRKMEK